MRILLIAALTIIGGLAAAAATPAWNEIRVSDSQDLLAHFKTPPSTTGVSLWWGWDGPMSQAVIERDLDKFKAFGISTVTIEAGYGMTARYLSEGWFELVRTAVAEANRRGMHIWIVDEGKYPSGFAGGKFSSERPDLRMRAVVVTEKISMQPGQTLTRNLPEDTLGVVAMNTSEARPR